MKIKKFKINEKIYYFFKDAYHFLKVYVLPVVYLVTALLALIIAFHGLVLVFVYLEKHPNIAISLGVFTVAIVLLTIVIAKFCVPADPKPNLKGIKIPKYENGLPMELVLFMKEVINDYNKSGYRVLDSLITENRQGNIPYHYHPIKQTDTEYIETCLIYDYQKCLKGEGIYQDVFDRLSKPEQNENNKV